jgi:trigger factor
MVDVEFDAIWKQIEKDRTEGRNDPADEGKDEDALKAEYRAIAERRVRLGLVLSEIGTANNISVTQADLNRAMITEARRYPGQEQQVMQYFQKNTQALESLRAPIFEEKVVDFILELAKVADKTVTMEELMSDPDAPTADAQTAEKAKAKAKPAAKAKAAKAETEEKTIEASAEAKPKPAAKAKKKKSDVTE